MTCKFTTATDSEAVLNHLRGPLILVYETLERSIPLVVETIKGQAIDFSPYLFSDFIRCHVRKALKTGGYEMEVSQSMLNVGNVANDGIDFRYGDLHIKMFKGPSLPKPTSPARESFYQENFAFVSSDFPGAPLRKLVILWDYYVESSTFGLQLVAPKDKDGETLWSIVVPPPAEWIAINDRIDIADEDIQLTRKRKVKRYEQ